MIPDALRPRLVHKNLRDVDTAEQPEQSWDVGAPHRPVLHRVLKVLRGDGDWCLSNEVHNLILRLQARNQSLVSRMPEGKGG